MAFAATALAPSVRPPAVAEETKAEMARYGAVFSRGQSPVDSNSSENTPGKDDYYDVDGRVDKETDHYDNVVGKTALTSFHVWHISLDGAISGLARADSIIQTKPKYDLACFNCADAAMSVGRACGAPVPAAGLPDLSIGEILRGLLKDNADWVKSLDSSEIDGTYSSPLGLLLKLYIINEMYGEQE